MTNEAPVVLVVDDDLSVRTSIKRLLQSAGHQVRTFCNTRQLFAHGRPEGPCCLILDVRIPDRDGLSFHEELIRAGIRVPTIFITGFGDIPMSVRAMKSGAVDFLPKPYEPPQLLGCVKAALELDARWLSERQQLDDIRTRYQSLTPREQEVFIAVASGMLNKQTAYQFGISEKTVKVHRARVMEKMLAEASADLVRMADLLDLPCRRDLAPKSGSVPNLNPAINR